MMTMEIYICGIECSPPCWKKMVMKIYFWYKFLKFYSFYIGLGTWTPQGGYQLEENGDGNIFLV